MVGQATLKGKLVVQPIKPIDRLHFTVATLAHDIGYLCGGCPADLAEEHLRRRPGPERAHNRPLHDQPTLPLITT